MAFSLEWNNSRLPVEFASYIYPQSCLERLHAVVTKERVIMKRKKVNSESVLASILSDESFWPSEPQSLRDTGLPESIIESLAIKRLSVIGHCSGRQLAQHICLPFHMFSDLLTSMRERQIIVHSGSAPFNDYIYALTEKGRERAQAAMKACAYVGPAPVPLADYVLSADAQTIRAESPQREQLLDAFRDISVDENMFDSLGPAINSGAGLFLYGEPGNGKSTLARRITKCFGQQIWIPRTIIEDGQIIKLFDPSLHRAAQTDDDNVLSKSSFDRRWIKIDRPTVVVGGELTMDALEIRHDPVSNVSEAPLQMKSNGGCFLIDDFGRQRIEPRELLNRWIVPLEARFDFLTLSTGKKIQVPFEQLIIFSTNLEPQDLVDEAFLRRIPYKIHVCDPSVDEFHELFEIYARQFACTYKPDVVDQLIANHYEAKQRPMRRCHPRDLLNQIKNYCAYNDLAVEMRDSYFDRVVKSYFAVVINAPTAPAVAATQPATNPSTKAPAPPSVKPPVNGDSAPPKRVATPSRKSVPRVQNPTQRRPISPSQPSPSTPVRNREPQSDPTPNGGAPHNGPQNGGPARNGPTPSRQPSKPPTTSRQQPPPRSAPAKSPPNSAPKAKDNPATPRAPQRGQETVRKTQSPLPVKPVASPPNKKPTGNE